VSIFASNTTSKAAKPMLHCAERQLAAEQQGADAAAAAVAARQDLRRRLRRVAGEATEAMRRRSATLQRRVHRQPN